MGEPVAIIGAGGIGFDVATFLTEPETNSPALATYMEEWGIDRSYANPGGITDPHPAASPRQVWLLQRSKGKFGASLGKPTGWAHRLTLRHRGVEMWGNVRYQKIDDAGLHLRVNDPPRLLDVEPIVICAGQEPQRSLQPTLEAAGVQVQLIGGAKLAAELDAKRAIEEGLLAAWAIVEPGT